MQLQVRVTLPNGSALPLSGHGETRYSRNMENDPTTYNVSLCLKDWERIVQALRNEAFQLTQESRRACEKGSTDYGTILWEECTSHNALADLIDFQIP